MSASGPTSRADGPSQATRGRVSGWLRDPAVWAWIGVAILALLPLGSALAQLAR